MRIKMRSGGCCLLKFPCSENRDRFIEDVQYTTAKSYNKLKESHEKWAQKKSRISTHEKNKQIAHEHLEISERNLIYFDFILRAICFSDIGNNFLNEGDKMPTFRTVKNISFWYLVKKSCFYIQKDYILILKYKRKIAKKLGIKFPVFILLK